MHPLTRFEPVAVPDSAIARITALYDRGLYVQAYEEAKAHGDLRGWIGTAAQLIGGRLAGNLGSRQIASWLHMRAWRGNRSHTEAAYFCGLTILERRGALAAWRFAKRLPSPTADDPLRGDLSTFRARVFGAFRDFERAEAELADAEASEGNLPWLWCERASILEMEDRYPEALEAARESLRLRPWFRPAVQQTAHLLQLSGRDEEAVALLNEALQNIESGACAGQLSAVLEELGRYEESIAAWAKMRALSPLLDDNAISAWHARMADLRYLAGDRAGASEHARQVKSELFYPAFAERLVSPESATLKRVHLDVGFVRQHHVTCAPATLTAVAGFLGDKIDHLALARELTYDGTPDHVERAWAEGSGFYVREFRVTWDVAVALIDRGVPFTLTTTEITSGHLQAVIGYDALRKTLIIRDPYLRHHSEFNVEPLLERYAAFGPRGMVLIPQREMHRIEGIELPDAAEFDCYYRVRRGLHVHDRAAAEAALTELETTAPNHRLTHFSRRTLAYYDGNLARQLATTEALLELYPKQGALLFGKSRALSELANRADYEAFLRTLADEDVDPLFWREWALFLSADARNRTKAMRILRRVLRFRSVDSENLASFANILWDERDFAQATELYRFAACLRDTVDGFSRSYFLAARHLRATEDALRWLRERQARHGSKSSQPARVLFWALNLLDRGDEAIAVLEEALTVRPDDGELLLHAADAFGRHGRSERADTLLAAAESRCSRTEWLRTAACVADYQGALARALALWRELLAAEPLAADTQRNTIRLIAEVEGRAAALAEIESLAQRFPHHVATHRLWVEYARHESHELFESIVRRSLVLDPNDAWLRRELALVLSRGRRFDEALLEADAALQIEPQNSYSHSVRGSVLHAAERLPEARAAFQGALRLSIDNAGVIPDLIDACPSVPEKKAAAEFVRGELIRQVVFGDGLLAFRDQFYSVLEPQEMLTAVQEAHTARPDLWHAWSALIRQLVDTQRLEEALQRANDCAARFPSVPGAWRDLALVHRLKGDREGEIRALRRAVIINPSWGSASRELATALESRADFAEARRVLESAIAASPLDPSNHSALADHLWRRGDRQAAIERVIIAVQREPGHSTAWDWLQTWTAEIHEPERAISVAQELTKTRPGEARSWYVLAQILPANRTAEAIEAIDRAIEFNPRMVDGHDLRAFLLSREGRFDEAAAACAPAAFAGDIPPTLGIRAAWIEARRGHSELAISQARKVIAAHPDFYWGWQQIAEWTFQLEKYQESLFACERLARLAPRSPVPLGYLARAQHALGRSADAFATLGRAFDLDPTYEFAGFTLFNHQLDARELDKAAATLARLETHLPGPETSAARVRFLAQKKDRNAALEALKRLFFVVECPDGVLSDTVEACIRAGWASGVDRLLDECVKEAGVHPHVGSIWVERVTATKSWRRPGRIYALDPRTEIGRRSRYALLSAIGRQNQTDHLNKLLRSERDSLRDSTALWGQTSFALASNGRWKETIAWMEDWRTRTELQPWMLSNLALALRHESRDGDAAAVHEHALTLHGDHTTEGHHRWLALDRAVQGAFDEAERHLARVSPRTGHSLDEAAHAIALGILTVHKAAPEQRPREFDAQRGILRDPRFRGALNSPIVKFLGQRGVDRMAQDAGRPSYRITPLINLGTGSNPVNITPFIVVAGIIIMNAVRLSGPPTPKYVVPTIPPQLQSRSLQTPRPIDPSELLPPKKMLLPITQPTPALNFPERSSDTLLDTKFEPIPTPRPTPEKGRQGTSETNP